MKHLALAIACLFIGATRGVAADRGFALVIGNASYPSAPLHTPTDDAKEIARLLTQRGLAVTAAYDLDRSAFAKALADFKKDIRGTSLLVIVYFAGHGIQVNGINYLIPIDAAISAPSDVPNATVSLDLVFAALQEAPAAPKLVIIDACRSNPFAVNAPNDWIQGLAIPTNTPSNSLVAYSTQPGNIAADGLRIYSPFARGLIDHVGDPGLRIEELLKSVRQDVVHGTDALQEPAEFSSLITRDVFITPPALVRISLGDVDDDAVVLVNNVEVTEWNNDGGLRKDTSLHAGLNPVIVKVYNQRSYTGGPPLLGGHLPEGWRYTAVFSAANGATLLTLSDREDRPADNGPRHGKLFTVATFDLDYDAKSMSITLKHQNLKAWNH